MATRQDQIQKTLARFYQNPVAKVSLETFLSVMAVIVFAFLAVKPTLVTISGLIKEIEDKQQLEEQLQRKIAALSTAQDIYLFNKDSFSLLDEALPSGPQLLYSLKVIEKLASDNDLVIDNISVPEIPEENESNAPISLTSVDPEMLERKDLTAKVALVGSYQDIRQFVEDLHQTRRTFVVHSASFNIKEDRGAKLLTANLAITMPYFETDQQKGGK
ncbi:MAG: hypothetical protein GF381_02810 [Candidatus Pacebacteria bacterium]|nr:hypothetical protein [Candidatus Paceibacterota bacterium]